MPDDLLEIINNDTGVYFVFKDTYEDESKGHCIKMEECIEALEGINRKKKPFFHDNKPITKVFHDMPRTHLE